MLANPECVNFVSVCDLNHLLLRSFAQRFDIQKTYTHADTMLAAEQVAVCFPGRACIPAPLHLRRLVVRFAGGFQGPFRPLSVLGQDPLEFMLRQTTPSLPCAVGPSLTGDPHHAVRFDCHQHRLAAQEDLIQAPHQHPRRTGPIQHRHDTARLRTGLLHPSPDRGATGTPAARQDDR
jgi:hypothetical protein